ncbi:NnrS family protein [Paracidovorax konjaci]|uniref:NnrS family protein n=1 Tax=Paracidovorax konjaci TaxID=32040 RepID=UPI003369E647
MPGAGLWQPWKTGRVPLVWVLHAGYAWPLALPAHTVHAVLVSATLWSMGFGLYALRYWPVLSRPRLDGRPGRARARQGTPRETRPATARRSPRLAERSAAVRVAPCGCVKARGRCAGRSARSWRPRRASRRDCSASRTRRR